MILDTIDYQLEYKVNPDYEEEVREWLDCGCDYDAPLPTYPVFNIILNGELITGTTDLFELLRVKDQKTCYDASWWKEIGNSHEYSQFYPFTCSCGIAGCAGIWDGVHLKVRKHTVEWRVGKNMGYDFLGKRFFQFDRTEYFKMLNRLALDAKQ